MNESYSNIAAGFANEVEKFSKSKLKRKAELIRIYEEALKNENEKLFDELVFTAKYVQGLMRAVKNGTNNPDVTNLEQIKKDFSDNIAKAVNIIKKIISDTNEEMKKHFDDTYFTLSQLSFLNLSELLNDLEWSKMFMNDIKRRRE